MDCFLCFVATSKSLAKDYANASEPTYAVQTFLHVLHVEVMLLLWVKYFYLHVQLTKRFGMLHYIVWLQMF